MKELRHKWVSFDASLPYRPSHGPAFINTQRYCADIWINAFARTGRSDRACAGPPVPCWAQWVREIDLAENRGGPRRS